MIVKGKYRVILMVFDFFMVYMKLIVVLWFCILEFLKFNLVLVKNGIV